MRWMLPVALTAFAVALSAAVIGDGTTEWVANTLAGHLVDAHQESLLPGAILAGVLVATVCGFAVCAGRRRAEAFAHVLAARPARLLFFVATAMLTVAIVVAMEGYETRFGGASAFDARSVLVHYLPAALAAYACIGALVDALLRACVNAALTAWDALSHAASPFARRRFAFPVRAALERGDGDRRAADAGQTHPLWSLRAPPVHGHWMSVAFARRISWNRIADAHDCARPPSPHSPCSLRPCRQATPPRLRRAVLPGS